MGGSFLNQKGSWIFNVMNDDENMLNKSLINSDPFFWVFFYSWTGAEQKLPMLHSADPCHFFADPTFHCTDLDPKNIYYSKSKKKY